MPTRRGRNAPARQRAATRRPSAARERILTAVDQLFYNEGIHAVGMSRVVDQSEVTRVTLYRHFSSKDDLIGAYLGRRADRARAHVAGLIARHGDDARAALRELGELFASAESLQEEHRGCPFVNAAAEFGDDGHAAHEAAVDQRRWITATLQDLLSRAGHPDPERAARLLVMLKTGLVVGASLENPAELDGQFHQEWSRITGEAGTDTAP